MKATSTSRASSTPAATLRPCSRRRARSPCSLSAKPTPTSPRSSPHVKPAAARHSRPRARLMAAASDARGMSVRRARSRPRSASVCAAPHATSTLRMRVFSMLRLPDLAVRYAPWRIDLLAPDRFRSMVAMLQEEVSSGMHAPVFDPRTKPPQASSPPDRGRTGDLAATSLPRLECPTLKPS